MTTSFNFEYSLEEPLVYFVVDTQELFQKKLDEEGVMSALQAAFQASKSKCPVDTGLMKSAYTFKRLNSHAIMCCFPPEKIVGHMRKGRIVEEYYPVYVAEESKRSHNYLNEMMKEFLSVLKSKLKVKISTKKIDPTIFDLYIKKFLKQYREKLKIKMEELTK